tara:strand:- start:4 stop:285 length:282 start_codon:yes stop_codon:yes gene_type:complete
MPELKRPSIKARKMMSAVAAIHPARRDREIDELDKVYTRLMLGEKLMNMQAPAPKAAKAAAPTITRQLQRRGERALAKQAKIKARIDAARQMG